MMLDTRKILDTEYPIPLTVIIKLTTGGMILIDDGGINYAGEDAHTLLEHIYDHDEDLLSVQLREIMDKVKELIK